MSVFVCGFNGFSQVSNSSADRFVTPLAVDKSLGISTLVKIPVTPLEASGLTCPKAAENREECDKTDCKGRIAEVLKNVVVSWDRISYLWNNGNVSCKGGPLDKEKNSASEKKPFHNLKLLSLCNARHKLCGIDTEGRCLIFSCGTLPVQLNSSRSLTNITKAYASENGQMILHHANRFITLCELQDGNYLQPYSLNFNVCIKSVSCGKHHILMVSVIGIVFSFGNGSQGQLGHGTIDTESEPRILEALEGVSVSQVSAGGWHSMALSDIGDVYVWGWNEKGQLGLPCRNLQHTLNHHSENPLELKTSKTNLTLNRDKIESDDNFVNIQPIPVVLDFSMNGPDEEVFVSEIACGSRHSVAVLEDGSVFSWGCNDYGQLGHGDTVSRDHPELIKFFLERGLCVDNVFSGFWNTVFLAQERNV